MARMRPELTDGDITKIKSAAERLVYKCFRDQLPNRMLVLHGLPLLKRLRPNRVIDGEVDFIVFDPQRGLLVVEVKGGGISYDPDAGWSSMDRSGATHSISDPFWQASSNKYEIVNFVGASRDWKFGAIPMGHAVLFPDVEPRGMRLPNVQPEIVGGLSECDRISNWIDRVYAFWNLRGTATLGRAGAPDFERLIFPRIIVPALLSARFREDDEKRVELTERQSMILQAARYHDKLVINGGAGTGKTLIATQRAIELAQSGLRTLYLCYNRPLADSITESSTRSENLHIFGFHSLCEHFVRMANRATNRSFLEEARDNFPGESEYDVQWPFALILAADAMPQERFDAIVVDEAQDFGDDYWLSVEILLRNETSKLLIFFDANQAIYRRSKKLPVKTPPFVLTRNCRNTKVIHEAGYRYYVGDTTDAPDIPGEKIRLLAAPSLLSQAKAIIAFIKEVAASDIRQDDIVILLEPAQKELLLETIGGMATGSLKFLTDDPLGRGGIRVVTAKRFKGLDASVIVLWGFDDVRSDELRQLLYVGCKRARNLLAIATKQATIDLAFPTFSDTPAD